MNIQFKLENQAGGQNSVLDPKVIADNEAVVMKGLFAISNGLAQSSFFLKTTGTDLTLTATAGNEKVFLGGEYHKGLNAYFYAFYEKTATYVWYGCINSAGAVVELGHVLCTTQPENACFIEIKDYMLINVPLLHVYRCSASVMDIFGMIEYKDTATEVASIAQVAGGGTLPAGTYKMYVAWAKANTTGSSTVLDIVGKCHQSYTSVTINLNDQLVVDVGNGWLTNYSQNYCVGCSSLYKAGITHLVYYVAPPKANVASNDYNLGDDLYFAACVAPFSDTMSATISSLGDFRINPTQAGIWSGNFDIYNFQCYDNAPPAGNKYDEASFWNNSPIEINGMAYGAGRFFFIYNDRVYFSKGGDINLNQAVPLLNWMQFDGKPKGIFNYKGDLIISTEVGNRILYGSDPPDNYWYWDEENLKWTTTMSGDSPKPVSSDYTVLSQASIRSVLDNVVFLARNKSDVALKSWSVNGMSQDDYLYKLGGSNINTFLASDQLTYGKNCTAFVYNTDDEIYYFLFNNNSYNKRVSTLVGFNMRSGATFTWEVNTALGYYPIAGTYHNNKNYLIVGDATNGRTLELREIVDDMQGEFEFRTKTYDYNFKNIRPVRVVLDFTYNGTY